MRSGSTPTTVMRLSIDSTVTGTLCGPLPGSMPLTSIQALNVDVMGWTPDGDEIADRRDRLDVGEQERRRSAGRGPRPGWTPANVCVLCENTRPP